MSHSWFNGTVVEASAQATRQNRILVACVVSSIDDDEMLTINTLFGHSDVLQVTKKHCVCLLLESGTDQAIIFTRLFPLDKTPTIYVIHSSGNAILTDDSLNPINLAEQIQERVDIATKAPIKHDVKPAAQEVHLDMHEAERLRKKLVKWRQDDQKHLAALRKDIDEDRKTYTMIHGPNRVLVKEKKKPATQSQKIARLQFRASNGLISRSEYPSDTLFATVREDAEKVFGMPAGKAEIFILFPQRKLLDGTVDNMTLKQLGLAPSATLFVRVWEKAQPPKEQPPKEQPPQQPQTKSASTYLSFYIALTVLALALLFWHIKAPPHAVV
ncbi:hypothetical protein LPJ78_005031 [Coemansia sp. RSA 989]|nr:hypothetical protein BX667DRAFT_198092 [Coemansia mojavensis]KAJ1739428.1 hypothetical protein LPJ68_004700 [Coemansia sp. RSA 1086]KAJ1750665.1 hypothetical protein LPJ79_002697 [Coemansia sp. RSA 1821]KAJ1861947.1 hypothetical protein LPJ78_005031 [Coemansia sp. RSA 989]KAJ2669450.1 hypothetical protein IWW42_004573 [Coemansia sp. RSA 1085]